MEYKKKGYFIKGLSLLIFIIIAVFGNLYFHENIKNWNAVKNDIVDEIQTNLSGKIVISGDLKFSFPNLKVPIITINDEDSQKTFLMQNVELKFNPFYFLFFIKKISSISADSALMPFHILSDTKKHLKSDNSGQISVLFKSLHLTFVPMIDNLYLGKSFFNCKYDANSVKSTMSTVMGNNEYKITVNSDAKNFQFSLKFKDHVAEINLNDSGGKISASGANLMSIFLDMYIANSIKDDEKKFVYDFTPQNDPFVFNAEFSMIDKNIYFKDFLISSEKTSIKVNEFKKDENELKADIIVDKLDLSTLINTGILNKNLFLLINNADVTLPQKINGHIKFEGKNISITDNDLISNIIFNAKITDSVANIEKFELKSDIVKAKFSGKLQNTDSHSNLIGKIEAEGEDFMRFVNIFKLDVESHELQPFRISSDIRFSPDIFIMSSFTLNAGKMRVFSDIDYKININEKKLRGFIEVHNLDYNTYFNSTSFNFFTYLLDLKTNANLSFRAFNTLVNGKHNIDDILMYFTIYDNMLDFENIAFNSSDAIFDASLTMATTNSKPILDLNIKGSYLNTEILNFNKLLTVTTQKNKQSSAVSWSKNAIDWFGLDDLDSNIIVDFKKMDFENGTIYDVDFSAKTTKNLMTIDKFFFKNGKNTTVRFSTYLGVEQNPSVRGSFAVYNADLNTFTSSILQLNDIAGYCSVYGDFLSKGSNIGELIKKLSGNVKIACSNVMIDKINFDSISSGLYSIQNRADLENLTRVKFFQGKTLLESINGEANLANGMASMLANFTSTTTNGIISSNFSFANFTISTITKMYFYIPQIRPEIPPRQIESVDCYMQGDLWHPRVFFNNNEIYDNVVQKMQSFAKLR